MTPLAASLAMQKHIGGGEMTIDNIIEGSLSEQATYIFSVKILSVMVVLISCFRSHS